MQLLGKCFTLLPAIGFERGFYAYKVPGEYGATVLGLGRWQLFIEPARSGPT